MKLLGLLKTIGMTKPQIKKLVHLESLEVSLPAIIVGDIVGISIGKIILNKIFVSNEMLTDVRLSLAVIILIILFSTAFTLLTVFLSVMRPARYAAKVSPIDASRYNETTIKKKYKSEDISLGKLARRQVFSNKFRFISIVLSISLSAVILNSVLTYTGNIDLEKGISDVIVTDYNIASPKYFRYMYSGSEDGIKGNFIDEIENQKGFKAGGALYYYGYEYDYPDIKIVGNKKTRSMLNDYYEIDSDHFIEVGEGDVLDLGDRKLTFYLTAMVHWPESMVSYDAENKILFSQDIFGGFGTNDGAIYDDELDYDLRRTEFRRYYTNIVGKYSQMAVRAINKLSSLE
ncbi:MAG: FtsX-like permease family protein, partial [Finegoldia magna]|nr:FtsX-like permease family protein [Finegoldia magna]